MADPMTQSAQISSSQLADGQNSTASSKDSKFSGKLSMPLTLNLHHLGVIYSMNNLFN